MNSACAWMEAALTVKGPASWEIEGPPSSSMLERGSQRSAASGVWSSERAKEAWDAYVHTNLAPVLASALAIKSGSGFQGEGDAAALLNLTLGQAHLFQQTMDACRQNHSSTQPDTAAESESPAPDLAENGNEAAVEQHSSATYDEALWAALAAAACIGTKSVAGAPAEVPESSQEGCLDGRHDHGSGSCKGSPSLSGESSDVDALDSWAGTFPSSHTPLSEPSSFNGTFRAQRARRTVRVIRTAARPRAPGEGTSAPSPAATTSTAARAAPPAGCSPPEAPACAGSPRRTRKKRAATSLMEGGVAFNKPSSGGPSGEDAANGGGGGGRQRTPGGASQSVPRPGTAVSSPGLPGESALPQALQTPLFMSAGLVSPLRSHQIDFPSTASSPSDSSTASQRQGSLQAEQTPLSRESLQQQTDPRPSGDTANAGSCWGRPPILLAAATGRADIVRHLIASAPKDPLNPRPTDYGRMQQELEEAAQQAAALGTQSCERAGLPRLPGPLVAAPPGLSQPNCLSLLHCTALHLAALFGHVHMAQILLTSPACSVHSRNAQGATALHVAAQEGWTQVVSLLARVPDCDLDACDYGGRTAMHLAAAMGRTDVVNKLWCCGCKIEPVDVGGWTALHYAAEAGHTGVVANLVIAGCHVHAGTSAGWTAAHLAAYSGHTDVLQKLLLGGYEVDCMSGTGGWTALHLAAHHGHLQAVNVLLMAGANARLKCITGGDVLQCAAESGCLEVFERILEVGKCDLAGLDMAGASLVHSAAKGGNGAILQKVLDLGGNESAVTSSGRTCLHYAAHGGHANMADWLLKRGAGPNHKDGAGVTPLMVATEIGAPELVSLLLSHGADLHACSAAGCTPLHFAACSGSEKAVGLLLDKGADPGVVCQQGTTALHHAAENNRPEVLARLLQCAEQPLVRVQDSLGWTALHYAAMHERSDCATQLLQAGALVDAKNTAGLTALHVAARARSLAVVRVLLASGCDGSLTDASGRAALHYAAQTGEWLLFSALYAHPACAVMDPDDRGLTPLHCAVEGGSPDIVGVLLVHKDSLGQSETASSPSELAQSAIFCNETAAGDLQGQQDRSKRPGGSDPQQRTPHAGDAAQSETAGSTASFTPLHVAAYKGHAELIPCLLQAGYAAGSLDTVRRTPLHYAALQGGRTFELPAGSQHETRFAAPPPLPQSPSGVAPRGLHEPTRCTADPHTKDGPAKQIPAAAGLTGLLPEPLCRPLSRSSSSGSSCTTAQSLRPDGAHPASSAAAAAGGASGPLPAQYLAARGQQARPGVLPAAVQWTGLMPRARLDYSGASELLLAAGADAHAVDVCGATALHYAAGTGDTALVEQLLDLGVAMGAVDIAGYTPVAWAAAGGHAPCVSLLLEAGSGVGAADNEGRLPLHWAAERGFAQVVALLVPAMLQSGLDLNALDNDGSSAVALAAAQGHVECVAQILDSTATAAERGLSALHLAVQDGLELLVSQLLLLPGAAPDSRDKDGLTPLHWAASRGSDAIVGQLLTAGADIDAVTNDSWTALHEASLNGHAAVVERLLHAGAQVGLKTSMGLTALHNAASNGHTAVVENLLAAGAAPNARALSNATALFCAAGAGHDAIVRRLLAVGAEVGVAAGAGATALHTAAGAGHLAVVESLLDAHADVDVQAQNGATALHNAAGGGCNAVVKALLAAKADTDIQNGNCNTALHLASGKGHLDVVETLLASGASAHIRNAKGWAAVHSAAAAGQLEVVLRLVAAGAAPRSRPDLDVLRLLTRKTTYRHSYVEGRLRLAEKERQRLKSRNAAGGAQTGPSEEDLASLEAQANANMAALLEEEEVKKDVDEKKKNKKKDKKKRKGKKGNEKEAEEEGGSADDAKQDETDATPSKAEHAAGAAEHQDTAEGVDIVAPPVERPNRVKKQPGKQGDGGGAQTSEALPSRQTATESARRSVRSKSPAKACGSRKGQVEVHASSKPSQVAAQAAEEEKNASEWQSVGAAQRKSRRALKAQEPQPTSAPRQLPANVSQRAQQQPPPPPPPPRPAVGSTTVLAKTAARAAGLGKATAPPPQESRPIRSQARATEAKAAADLVGHGRGTPSFADVARPGHTRPAKEGPPPTAAAASDATQSGDATAAASQGPPSPGSERPGPAELPLPATAAAAAQGAPDAVQHSDIARPATDEVPPLQFGSQPPAPVAQPRHLPAPETSPSALAPISSSRGPGPAAPQPQPPPDPICAAPQSSTAPSSGLSALAKIWRPAAAEASPTGNRRDPIAAESWSGAQLHEGNAEAGSATLKAQVQPVAKEGVGSAVPISAAPAIWRSGLHARSVDWSFPRNGSGTSLSSLAPQKQANGGPFLDGASDRVTCSSLESSASLGLPEGLLTPEPLADGSSASKSGHGTASASRLQYSSSPLGHMSMGSGGIHRAAAPASPKKDYAAVLNDIWNSPQRERHPAPGTGQMINAVSGPSPPLQPHDTEAASESNSEVQRMAEAYQLTCPITRELMRDPVVASDGYTYERSAIEAWMASAGVSPRTGQPLKHKDLVPNLTLRASISILIPRSCLASHF